jgi:hypothetical protein
VPPCRIAHWDCLSGKASGATSNTDAIAFYSLQYQRTMTKAKVLGKRVDATGI